MKTEIKKQSIIKISTELKYEIRNCIKAIPKRVFPYYNGSPYELLIYEKRGEEDCELVDFTTFEGMKDLDKRIQIVINHYKNLSHIDFKWSEEEDEFDQFTIFEV